MNQSCTCTSVHVRVQLYMYMYEYNYTCTCNCHVCVIIYVYVNLISSVSSDNPANNWSRVVLRTMVVVESLNDISLSPSDKL